MPRRRDGGIIVVRKPSCKKTDSFPSTPGREWTMGNIARLPCGPRKGLNPDTFLARHAGRQKCSVVLYA